MKIYIKLFGKTRNYFVYEDQSATMYAHNGTFDNTISFYSVMKDIVSKHYGKTVEDIKIFFKHYYNAITYSVEIA